jgi:hypothetical protein
METDYGLDGRRARFSLLQIGSGTHPASSPTGARALSPRVKREADHSPPTSVEVKKIWIYTSTPPLKNFLFSTSSRFSEFKVKVML